MFNNNNNNNNCLKSNIQCIEIRVQWTVHLGSSHMHVHAVTRVHAVTPKLVICVMYLTSIWRILLMTDGLNAVWSNDRAAHTDTNPKNLELAPPQSITATRLDQLVYSPNYYIQISRLKIIARSEKRTFTLRALSLGRLPLRHESYITGDFCLRVAEPEWVNHVYVSQSQNE